METFLVIWCLIVILNLAVIERRLWKIQFVIAQFHAEKDAAGETGPGRPS